MRASILALIACCAAIPLSAHAQSPGPAQETKARDPFVRAVAEEAVRELATKLEQSFVFPDKGMAYAAMLRSNLATGQYASFADAQEFADAVTADLQAVHKDGHLRVHVVPPEARSGPGGESEAAAEAEAPAQEGITRSGWISDGVAYIGFDLFPGDKHTLARLRAFIDEHRDAKTLIIDARSHRGGGLEEMDLMLPELFGEPTVLVTMDTRSAVDQRGENPVGNAPSLRQIDGPEGVVRREHFVTPAATPTGLRSARLFLLTSNRTASAGEHLALALKRTKRATLVGEVTMGAGHYGGMMPLDPGFNYAAFIPVGRTFDPDTGAGWEGTGVKPDVEAPAEKALDAALRLVGLPVPGDAALAQLK